MPCIHDLLTAEVPFEETIFLLDFDSLILEMRAQAGAVRRSADESRQRRQQAAEQLERARQMPELRAAAEAAGQHMALPPVGGDMGEWFPAPSEDGYTVLATDGSQVPPDYHHVAPWFVVNTGAAILRYLAPPGRPRSRLFSQPRLLPPRTGSTPAEAPPQEDPNTDARAAAVSETGPVEVERLLGELRLARELLQSEGDAGRTVLLLDGPLVQWRMITSLKNRSDQERVTGAFRDLLGTARETGTPIAGYISRSRAVEWVTLLRFSCCPEVVRRGMLCGRCKATLFDAGGYDAPPADAHHAALAGVRDIEVADQVIPAEAVGGRTAVIELKSETWRRLAGDDPAGFFYLRSGEANRGGELARVELPLWVARDRALMDRLHAVLTHQCALGRGYPMILSEAHEAAVVRAGDRATFFTLMERTLSAQGVHQAVTSAKAMSKRRPLA